MNQFTINSLPKVAAVYALCSGNRKARYVAYVGLAEDLRQRINQHLVRRDSSVVTGISAVKLDPDKVTEVRWWQHSDFGNREKLEAAELIAFETLDPVLRSRGKITDRARQMSKDENFNAEMSKFFLSAPSGYLLIPSLTERVADLELRIKVIEDRLRGG